MKKNNELNPEIFDSISELGSCCAKSVVLISKKYNEDPMLINRLFIEFYTKMSADAENSK